jgi:2-oxoglutarate dehydrogenase E2 component (dihydrolipoamide succinyltransferase)
VNHLARQENAGWPTPAAPAPPTPAPAAPEPHEAEPVRLEDRRTDREERERISLRRKTIARRLVEAQRTAALLTTFNDVDMSAVMRIRGAHNDEFRARHGVGLGIVSFFVRAAVAALKAIPQLNSELQEDELVIKHHYDIGVAIATEEGLVVPVLRDADRMSFAEIERAILAFVDAAEKKTLSLEDLRGGTFTITNGGVFGSLLSTPILNPPQAGILGLHRIEDRPVARDGQIVVRAMMYVALTYDHRIVDGREAVRFLVHIKQLLESPEELLLES